MDRNRRPLTYGEQIGGCCAGCGCLFLLILGALAFIGAFL